MEGREGVSVAAAVRARRSSCVLFLLRSFVCRSCCAFALGRGGNRGETTMMEFLHVSDVLFGHRCRNGSVSLWVGSPASAKLLLIVYGIQSFNSIFRERSHATCCGLSATLAIGHCKTWRHEPVKVGRASSSAASTAPKRVASETAPRASPPLNF